MGGWERISKSVDFDGDYVMVKIKNRDFRELRVWVKAADLADRIYDVTGGFPRDEIYGLTSQLRRASVSVFSNIAEGCGKRTSKEFVSFLYNAMGSVREIEAQLIFSGRRGYLGEDEVKGLVGDFEGLGKMIARFVEFVLSENVR